MSEIPDYAENAAREYLGKNYSSSPQSIKNYIDGIAIPALASVIRKHAPSEAGGWLSIESAPREGRHILVYCPENECCFSVSWNKTHEKWMIWGAFEYPLSYIPTLWKFPNPPKEGGE